MAGELPDANGPQALSWWMFEEADTPLLDGNTTNNNDLSKVGTPTFQSTDKIQGSYSVIATSAAYVYSSYANLSSNFPFKGTTNDFTIGGWIKIPGGINGTYQQFSDDATHGYIFQVSSGSILFVLRSASSLTLTSNSNGYTTAQWIHITARWQGSSDDEVSRWVNGVKQTSTCTRTSVVLNTGSNHIYFQMPAGGSTNYDEW